MYAPADREPEAETYQVGRALPGHHSLKLRCGRGQGRLGREPGDPGLGARQLGRTVGLSGRREHGHPDQRRARRRVAVGYVRGHACERRDPGRRDDQDRAGAAVTPGPCGTGGPGAVPPRGPESARGVGREVGHDRDACPWRLGKLCSTWRVSRTSAARRAARRPERWAAWRPACRRPRRVRPRRSRRSRVPRQGRADGRRDERRRGPRAPAASDQRAHAVLGPRRWQPVAAAAAVAGLAMGAASSTTVDIQGPAGRQEAHDGQDPGHRAETPSSSSASRSSRSWPPARPRCRPRAWSIFALLKAEMKGLAQCTMLLASRSFGMEAPKARLLAAGRSSRPWGRASIKGKMFKGDFSTSVKWKTPQASFSDRGRVRGELLEGRGHAEESRRRSTRTPRSRAPEGQGNFSCKKVISAAKHGVEKALTVARVLKAE